MNIPIMDHSRHRKRHRLLQGALVTACVLVAHPGAAQLGPMPPPLIGTTPGTVASGDALAQTAANLAALSATATANTTALTQVQAVANAAVPNTHINRPNGVLGLDGSGNVSMAVRLGTSSTPINRTIVRTPFTYGNYENAVGMSVRANCSTCRPGVLSGFENGAPNISQDPSLDSVGALISNFSPTATQTLSSPTYDATHIYPTPPLTAAQIATIVPGMFVMTTPPPIATVTLTNPFSVQAYSSVVTVAWPNHGLSVGNIVTFAPSGGGTNITVGSRNLASSFTVASVVDANTITVKLAFLSTSAATSVGGTVTATATGTPWRGAVTAVAADGSSITMQDWSQAGNAAAGQVPTNGLTAYVNATTNIWAENIITQLYEPNTATGVTTHFSDGAEYDIYNDTDITKSSPLTQQNGIELVQMGRNPTSGGITAADDGVIVRGVWERGVTVRGAQDAGFLFDPIAQPTLGAPHFAGFLAREATGNAFGVLPGDGAGYSWRVDAATGDTYVGNNGSVLDDHRLFLGNNTTADNIDFGFGATGSDFNMRFSNGTAGYMQLYGTRSSDSGHLPIMTWRGADANYALVTGGATGSPVVIAGAGDANANLELKGSGNGGVFIGATEVGADPTTGTVQNGTCAPWYNTSTHIYSLACYFNGAIQKAQVTSSGYPTTPQYTVATLPTCNAANDGQFAEVTDQSGTPSYGGALTGNGSLHWPVFCNSTSWMAH